MIAGLGLMATGCAQKVMSPVGQPWPDTRPEPTPRPAPSSMRQRPAIPQPPAATSVSPALAALRPVPRSYWAKGQPIPTRLNPLNGAQRITIHHEGSSNFWSNDVSATAARIEMIRQQHLQRMTAGDIGYHFIVDRAGRLWEGRQLVFQGAHVKDQNEHNVGVMVLGNFETQRPTQQQLATLQRTLAAISGTYRIRSSRVYSHQELAATLCPGKSLQPYMTSLRRGLA